MLFVLAISTWAVAARAEDFAAYVLRIIPTINTAIREAVRGVNAEESFRKVGSTDDGRCMAGLLARAMGLCRDPSQRQGGPSLLSEEAS